MVRGDVLQEVLASAFLAELGAGAVPAGAVVDGEVGLDGAVPFRFAEVLPRGAGVGAGIVDEDVDRAELGFDLAGHRGDGVRVGEVGADLDSRAALVADGAGLVDLCEVADGDGGSGSGQGSADCGADPGGSAGDQGDPAL